MSDEIISQTALNGRWKGCRSWILNSVTVVPHKSIDQKTAKRLQPGIFMLLKEIQNEGTRWENWYMSKIIESCNLGMVPGLLYNMWSIF